MKEEIKNNLEIEKVLENEPVVVAKMGYHRVTPEERIENIKKEFRSELKRDLTDSELNEYLRLFDKEETNFWKYLWKIDPSKKPVIPGKEDNLSAKSKIADEDKIVMH
jgi:DNA-directed RNA polymerase specialized sigma subunit